jgi:hypothetical protein
MSTPYIQNFFTSRDNNANASTYVGQEGRLWWDPISNGIYYSDGNTPGGLPVAGGGGGGGSNITIQNQGNTLTNTANLINFTGPGVVSTSVGNAVTVAISANTGNILIDNTTIGTVYENSDIFIQTTTSDLSSIYSWKFDTVGNITLPANDVSINYANGTPYGGDKLPSQTGNSQKFLQTDGSATSWQYVAGVFGLWINGGTAFNAGNCLVVDGGGA